MTDHDQLADKSHTSLDSLLARRAAGDLTAQDELLGFACARMQVIAHRMLKRFPTVRRWDETDDVVQNAAIRLSKTLTQLTPESSRGFIGLMALHIRRELLDLARKHSGPRGIGANHGTNVGRHDGGARLAVEEAIDGSETFDQLERWTRLHEAAESLPEAEREMFHLVWYMGLKQADICDLLGCSIRTVKRRWESAKQHLADAVLGSPLS